MSRRGESIYKRSDGRWEARYIHHYEDGKAKYRYVYANSYTEVKEKRLESLRMMEKALEAASRREATFEELATLWLAEVRPNVKESTYTRYYRTITRYLNPNLAQIKVAKMDYQFLKLFARELQDHGGKDQMPLSSKTVNDILCVVKSMFRFGRMYGFPCAELASLPCSVRYRKPTNILEPEKRKELEQKLMNSEKNDSKDRVRLGILFTLYTGLRIGELCGLRFGDIDFQAKTVTIKRTVERIMNLDKTSLSRTRLVIGEPKTEQSIRTIPLPSFLVSYLEQYKLDDELYFLTASEKPTEPNQFYVRYRNYMRRNDLDGYTFHSLRHTFATRCIESGFDVKSLSEILGHASISTTLSIYVHPTMEQKRKQMEWLTLDSVADLKLKNS